MNKTFQGIYASYIEQLIDFKRKLGFKYLTEEVILSKFDKFTIERGEKALGITKDLAEEWNMKRANESESYRYHRAICLGQLCSFLCKSGIHSYIPRLPSFKSTFTPYIFTNEQVASIFRACDKLRAKKKHMDSILISLPSLIRFLHATGLRISEALSLKNKDVKLNDKYILVKDCKSQKERILPISDSLVSVCEKFIKSKELMPLVISDTDYFFVSLAGTRINTDVVYKWFRMIIWHAGISRTDSGPRLHDIRHTFSVHTLVNMAESGTDLYCSLPILSAYLGHQNLESTNLYVRLTSEMHPGLITDINMICFNVFPNLIPDETY